MIYRMTSIRTQPPPPSRIKLGGIKPKPEVKRMPLTEVQARVLRSLGILDEPEPERVDADVIGRAREFAEHQRRIQEQTAPPPPWRMPDPKAVAAALRAVDLPSVIPTAAQIYQRTPEQVCGRRDKQSLAARQMAMNELRRRRLSLTMVASMLRARSHSSVCGAVRRVKWMLRRAKRAA